MTTSTTTTSNEDVEDNGATELRTTPCHPSVVILAPARELARQFIWTCAKCVSIRVCESRRWRMEAEL